MVVVMSDKAIPMDTFPMAVKFGVFRVLYFIKSCPIALCLVNISIAMTTFIFKNSLNIIYLLLNHIKSPI